MVVQVRLRVSDTGGDAGRTEEDTAKLRAELSELDVELDARAQRKPEKTG
jgi:hypothetical protein